MVNKRKLGTTYEKAAADDLQKRGYCVLETNYRTRYGEIDLICLTPERDTCVFTEVKYRARDVSEALEAVDARKQRRLTRMAEEYIRAHPETADEMMRFDVIGIDGSGRVIHVENAFDAFE